MFTDADLTLPLKTVIADRGVDSISGKMNRPSPQNMKARLEWGAAASSMVMTNGIMYGQKEIARVPNADMKMRTTI